MKTYAVTYEDDRFRDNVVIVNSLSESEAVDRVHAWLKGRGIETPYEDKTIPWVKVLVEIEPSLHDGDVQELCWL